MTEEEQDSLVKGIIYKRFNKYLDMYDDMYQEGRTLLLVFTQRKDINDDYFRYHATLDIVSGVWKMLLKSWGVYEEDGERVYPVYTEIKDEGCANGTAFEETLVDELITPLTQKERKLLKLYYMEGLTAKECADETSYTTKSVGQTVSVLRKKVLNYEATGECVCRDIQVMDTSTGMRFDSIASAAKLNDINPTTLAGYLSGRCTNKTTLVYV